METFRMNSHWAGKERRASERGQCSRLRNSTQHSWRPESPCPAAETERIPVELEFPGEAYGMWSNESGEVGRGRALCPADSGTILVLKCPKQRSDRTRSGFLFSIFL